MEERVKEGVAEEKVAGEGIPATQRRERRCGKSCLSHQSRTARYSKQLVEAPQVLPRPRCGLCDQGMAHRLHPQTRLHWRESA